MSNLQAFLNPIKPENKKVVVSKRFVDPETGQPVEWEIQAICTEEEEQIRKKSMRMVPVPKKAGQFMEKADQEVYVRGLAVACTVFPNLNDAELQNAYGVMGAGDLLATMLLPGEYAGYLEKIQEITGFDRAMEDDIDDAKN